MSMGITAPEAGPVAGGNGSPAAAGTAAYMGAVTKRDHSSPGLDPSSPGLEPSSLIEGVQILVLSYQPLIGTIIIIES